MRHLLLAIGLLNYSLALLNFYFFLVDNDSLNLVAACFATFSGTFVFISRQAISEREVDKP